jgi:hypothetical protein
MSEQDNKQIIEQVERLRKRFKTEVKRDKDAVKMSFLDEVNALIRKVFHDSDTDIYDALNPEFLAKWKKRRWRRLLAAINFEKIFLFALLVTIIGFLVTEALPFYMVGDTITTKTWVKAILTEICFIFVSSYRAVGWLQTSMITFARAGIFALMLFVISSEVTLEGLNKVNEIDVIGQKIELLEEQIKQKDELIEFYKKKGWGNNTKIQSDEKNKLVEQLIGLKNQQIDGANEKASDLIIWKTWAKALFRVMLMFITVLISRKLFAV